MNRFVPSIEAESQRSIAFSTRELNFVPSVHPANPVVLGLPEEGQDVGVAPAVVAETGPVVVVGPVAWKEIEDAVIAVGRLPFMTSA